MLSRLMLNIWLIIYTLFFALFFTLIFVFNAAKVEIIFERQKKNVSFFMKKLTFYKILPQKKGKVSRYTLLYIWGTCSRRH